MSQGPQSEELRVHSAFGEWLRRYGWRIGVYAILSVLAFANVYPFLWMTGTSLKATGEDIQLKSHLLPQLKFQLADDSFLAPFYQGDDGTLINTANRDLVAKAKSETEATIDKLVKADEANDTLNQTQRDLLKDLRITDLKNRVINSVFIPHAVGVDDYQAKAKYTLKDDDGLTVRDLDRSLQDLRALEAAGYLSSIRPIFDNYVYVWSEMKFWMYTATSFLMTAAVVIIVVLMSAMLGYALARIKFPGKWLLLFLLIGGSVAPSEANIIAIFRLLLATGSLETMWGTIVWLAGVSIGNALLMAGFFLTLPKEVEEAAYVDGAGPFRTFFAIAMPMAKPIVMTVGLFAFLGAWNNFIIPLITTISDPSMQPLAMAVYMFRSGFEQQWNWINAASALMVIPVILLFILLQRYIVNAIAVGAVKG